MASLRLPFGPTVTRTGCGQEISRDAAHRSSEAFLVDELVAHAPGTRGVVPHLVSAACDGDQLDARDSTVSRVRVPPRQPTRRQ